MYYNFYMACKSYVLKINYSISPYQNDPAAVKNIPLLKLLLFDTILNGLNYFVLEIYINNRKRSHRRDG